MKEFTTSSGYTLHIIPVGRLALQDLLYRLGVQRSIVENKISIVLANTDEDKQQKALWQIFNYCFSFGVSDNPSDDDLRLLDQLGFETKNEKVARINWLRYIVLTDEKEAGRLWADVMAETFGVEQEPQPEQDAEEDED